MVPKESSTLIDKETLLNTNGWKDIEDTQEKTSYVWQFGGFCKDDDGNILKSHIMCGMCGLKMNYYNNTTSFRHHLKNHHPIEYLELIEYEAKEPKSLILDSVEKLSGKEYEYENGENCFVCMIYLKQFQTRSGLSLHGNIHLPEMLFKCDICEKGFSKKVHRKVHLKKSHNQDMNNIQASFKHNDEKNNKDRFDKENIAKIKTELPSWEGGRLFPPLRKSPNASPAWKLGGFRMDASG